MEKENDLVVKSLLPLFEHPNFYKIQSEFFELIEEDFLVYEQLGLASRKFLDSEVKLSKINRNKLANYFDEEVVQMYLAKQYLLEYFENEEDKMKDIVIEVDETDGLFFGQRPGTQKTYLRGDLENLPIEVYSVASELLRRAYLRYKSFNPTQQKKLVSNNLLQNVYEFKYKNLRLVYQYVYGNNLFFVGIFEKKSTIDKYLTSTLIDRTHKLTNQFNKIKDDALRNIVPPELLKFNSLEYCECKKVVSSSKQK